MGLETTLENERDIPALSRNVLVERENTFNRML
jgi:hypothetical protein